MFFILSPINYIVGLIIGLCLRPIFWLVSYLWHVTISIVKHLLGLILQLMLILVILMIQSIKDGYHYLVKRHPHLQSTLPLVMLITIILVFIWIVLMPH